MHTRSPDWKFGPRIRHTAEQEAWWSAHEPVVEAWLAEMEAAQDPWWQSAEHAAYCLVDAPTYLPGDARLSWAEFDVPTFLFHDLSEGGTVGFFGSVEIFFEQLCEALRRFGAAGLIDPERTDTWLAQMGAARADFLRHYDEDTTEEEAIAIRQTHLQRPWRQPSDC